MGQALEKNNSPLTLITQQNSPVMVPVAGDKLKSSIPPKINQRLENAFQNIKNDLFEKMVADGGSKMLSRLNAEQHTLDLFERLKEFGDYLLNDAEWKPRMVTKHDRTKFLEENLLDPDGNHHVVCGQLGQDLVHNKNLFKYIGEFLNNKTAEKSNNLA